MTQTLLRLVIFDVDGTLVDSQMDILGAMGRAFTAEGLTPPSKEQTLSIVGLSLDELMLVLAPDQDKPRRDRLVDGYKDSYMTLRAEAGVGQSSPLYPNVADVLAQLHAVPEVLLGVATGKSKRGLDKLIEGHGLQGLFVTQQVADFHPSKPHPSMILQAMEEVGVEPHQTVMVGDTSFDMEMAAAAGITGIAVAWGYHGKERLGAAKHFIDNMAALPKLLDDIWKERL